jgi:hypothetical protein
MWQISSTGQSSPRLGEGDISDLLAQGIQGFNMLHDETAGCEQIDLLSLIQDDGDGLKTETDEITAEYSYSLLTQKALWKVPCLLLTQSTSLTAWTTSMQGINTDDFCSTANLLI